MGDIALRLDDVPSSRVEGQDYCCHSCSYLTAGYTFPHVTIDPDFDELASLLYRKDNSCYRSDKFPGRTHAPLSTPLAGLMPSRRFCSYVVNQKHRHPGEV